MIKNLEILLGTVEKYLPFYEKQVEGISKSPIGWHIEPLLLTLDRVIERLSQTNKKNYKWKFNLSRLVILTTGKIPRGRAKSPSSVRPQTDIHQESLTSHLKLTRDKLKQLEQLDPGQYFEHPYFGHIKLKQTVRFLEIHTTHHLQIIKDIRG